MADADEAVQQADEERPSTEVVAERLGAAEAADDTAEVQREVEFAAVERLMFFSDAVIAIALTLLALELPVPGGIENADDITTSEMVRDAGEHFNDYLAFLISYLVIASHWRIHHRVFRYVREATTPIIQLNILWLLFVVITPFTTRMLSAGQMNILRFGTYAGTQAIQYGIFTLISLLIVSGQHIRAGTDLYRFRRGRVMTIAMAVCFAVSIPLYLVIGQGAFVLWAGRTYRDQSDLEAATPTDSGAGLSHCCRQTQGPRSAGRHDGAGYGATFPRSLRAANQSAGIIGPAAPWLGRVGSLEGPRAGRCPR